MCGGGAPLRRKKDGCLLFSLHFTTTVIVSKTSRLRISNLRRKFPSGPPITFICSLPALWSTISHRDFSNLFTGGFNYGNLVKATGLDHI